VNCQCKNCHNLALYGSTYGNATFCKNHKLNGFKLVSQFCKTFGCNKYPSYNYENEIGCKFCFNHKVEGMISKDNRKCLEENCKKRPTYNYVNKHKPIYCFNHKLEGMVSKDNRKCLKDNCNLRPSCNYENENKPIYCSKHKLENMINIISEKCEHKPCKLKPSYNFENEIGHRFCFNHKLEGMISKDSRKCISNLCFGTRGNKNYNGYCTYCFQYLFPDNPLTLQIRKKSKELKVRDYLFQEF